MTDTGARSLPEQGLFCLDAFRVKVCDVDYTAITAGGLRSRDSLEEESMNGLRHSHLAGYARSNGNVSNEHQRAEQSHRVRCSFSFLAAVSIPSLLLTAAPSICDDLTEAGVGPAPAVDRIPVAEVGIFAEGVEQSIPRPPCEVSPLADQGRGREAKTGSPGAQDTEYTPLPEGLGAALRQVQLEERHRLVPLDRPAGPAWGTGPLAGKITTLFTPEGIRVSGTEQDERPWAFELCLERWGRGGSLLPVEKGIGEAKGARFEFRRGDILEWYVNDDRGVEHGFTISSPPPTVSEGDAPLKLLLVIGGGWSGEVLANGRGAVFSTGERGQRVFYSGLRVQDAQGNELDARLAVAGSAMSILVEDKEGCYPLYVDPWIWTEQAILTGGAAGDSFGLSVALDGDTALIGAMQDDTLATDAGSAYVFVRSGTVWGLQTKLMAWDGAADDWFGYGVALGGDTAIIGAPWDDDLGATSGSAYVFVRSGSSWSPAQKLTASDGASGDMFAEAIALDGDTAIFGARFHDHTAPDAGSAYVFVRTGSTWAEQAEFLASNGAQDDIFGGGVTLDGNTALVGANRNDALAPDAGSAYVFVRQGTVWSEQARLNAPGGAARDLFGTAVSLDGETALVGASNNDDLALDAGSAYVFVRSGTTWGFQAQLFAPDGVPFDEFGLPSLDGDTAVIGAPWHEHTGVKVGGAYIFARTGAAWNYQAELLASNGQSGDKFGSVSVSGDTALVGAQFADTHDTDSGSAYVFIREYCQTASATYRNDAGGTNVSGYWASPPVLGAIWNANVDNGLTGNLGAGVVGFASSLEVYLSGIGDWLLVNVRDPGGELLGLPEELGVGIVAFDLGVPLDPSLCGFSLSTQGYGFGGGAGIVLHNAYDLVVGS